MSYNTVDTQANGYSVKANSTPFSDFDAGQIFLDVFRQQVGSNAFSFTVISERTNGNRRECLYEITFQSAPSSSFFVYCFQTEGGGRSNLPNEARIQWRVHTLWSPDLSSVPKAKEFSNEVNGGAGNLTGKECYVFSFYKRDSHDQDVVISAAYPSQAQDVELTSTSNKSIQFSYTDIRDAFIGGISATVKGNSQVVIHFKPEYLIWYMLNRDTLHTSTLQQIQQAAASATQRQSTARQQQMQPVSPVPGSMSNIPRNKIIYGAPGTGKSFELRNQARNLGFTEDRMIRVTFHPNYSYQQFVGAYKPVPIYKSVSSGTELYDSDKVTRLENQHNREPLIDYSFVPGPFLVQLIKALKLPSDNFLLIVEEINRASVSSVFGDVFQLLDRNTSGESEYEIEFNTDVSNYLKSVDIHNSKVKIPSNLFVWATMNSADQGVMPLDSAFKRRWAFEYLPLDAKAMEVDTAEIMFMGSRYNWNRFRQIINLELKELHVPEDKLIGPFFLSQSEMENPDIIKNKLLLYLRDDIVRHNPESLFNAVAFSDIIANYEAGNQIFNGLDFTSAAVEEV